MQEKTIKLKVDADQANKEVEKFDSNLKKTDETTKGLTSRLDQMTGGFITKAKGATGALRGWTKVFKSLRVAIISTGIGALLISITSIITAFKASEEGQNRYAKLLGVIGAVVGNLVDIISDFGEVLINAITNPRKAWDSFVETLDKGYQFIKKQIIDRFSGAWKILSGGIQAGILKMRIAWNEFTGDAEEADQLRKELEEVNEKIKEGIRLTEQANQEIVSLYKKSTDAVKEFIKEQEREIAIAKRIADQRATADKLERRLLVARAKADRDRAELLEQAVNKDKFSIQERIAFLEEASKIEQEITDREISAARLRLNAKVAENALNKSTKEDLNEEAELRANLIRLETAKLTKQKEVTSQIIAARQEQKLKDEAEKKALEEKARLEDELLSKENEDREARRLKQEKFEASLIEEEAKRLERLIEISEQEREIRKRQLEDKIAFYKEDAQARKDAEIELKNFLLDNSIETKTLRVNLDKAEKSEKQKISDEEKKRDELLARNKVALQQNVSNLITAIAGEDSKVAKGLQIAQATISGIQGVQNAYTTAQKSPITTFFPAYPIIQASLAGAFSALQIRQIASVDASGSGGSLGSGGGFGGGTVPNAPSFNLVQGTESNQILEGINNQNQNPPKSQVVSSEVTSQQALDRRAKAGASL